MDNSEVTADIAQTFMMAAIACVTAPIMAGAVLPFWANAGLCLMSPACFTLAMACAFLNLAPAAIRQHNCRFIPAVWDLSKLPLCAVVERNGELFLRADRPGVVWRLDPIYIPMNDRIWAADLQGPMSDSATASIEYGPALCSYLGKSIPAHLAVDGKTYSPKHRATQEELTGKLPARHVFYRGFVYEPEVQ